MKARAPIIGLYTPAGASHPMKASQRWRAIPMCSAARHCLRRDPRRSPSSWAPAPAATGLSPAMTDFILMSEEHLLHFVTGPTLGSRTVTNEVVTADNSAVPQCTRRAPDRLRRVSTRRRDAAADCAG